MLMHEKTCVIPIFKVKILVKPADVYPDQLASLASRSASTLLAKERIEFWDNFAYSALFQVNMVKVQ